MPVKKEKAKSKRTKETAVKKAVKKPVKKETAKKTVEKPVKKPVVKEIPQKEVETPEKKRNILLATGKRKTAVARIQFFPQGQGKILINKKSVKEYFPVFGLPELILSPLRLLKKEKDVDVKVKVRGGGVRGQAEAVRLGITRALVSLNPEWRKELKSAGFLRRDPRKKERKKPGLKRARRAPQWAKR